jgi:hypothetical protein
MSAGRIAKGFWLMSQEFSPAGIIITLVLYVHMSRGMNNRPVGGLGSETSYPIDMINELLSFVYSFTAIVTTK